MHLVMTGKLALPSSGVDLQNGYVSVIEMGIPMKVEFDLNKNLSSLF
jgi:hypothetical protein